MEKSRVSGEEAIKILAITILSEIVYWYRPSKSGEKKFAEDIWQCNYSYFEEVFGLSRKQILTAFECLEELDLVYREFRSIKVRGRSINNVLYIGLNANKVLELSGGTLSTSMEIGCDIKEESVSTCKVTSISSKVKTNTKTISNNSTKITTKTNSTTGVAKIILSQFNLSERDSLSAFIFPSNVLTIVGVGLLLSVSIINLLLNLMFLGEIKGFVILDFCSILTLILMLFFSVSANLGFKSAFRLNRFFFLPALLWMIVRTLKSFFVSGVGRALCESIIILGTFFWQIKGARFFSIKTT